MASRKLKSFQESKDHILNKWCIGLLSLGLISTSVLAGSTSSPPLPNGAICTVTIDSPLTGDDPLLLPNGDSTMDIPVLGSANVTEGNPLNASFVYVLDISGSTAEGGGTGCSPILACEQQFLTSLNQEIVNKGISTEVGVVVYAATAEIADMTPASSVETIIAPNAGDVDYPSYLETVVNSTISYPLDPNKFPSRVDQFTSYSVGRTTDCREGLQKALTVANATTNEPKIVVFTSDGICNEGGQTNFDNAVQALANAGVIVHSIAIGTESSCTTNDGHGSLAQIAQGTGGQCFQVADPGNLPAIIPSLVAPVLESLFLEIDGGTPIQIFNEEITPELPLPQPGPVLVDYITLAESLGVGIHDICVTANCSEPEGIGSAKQCETIEIISPPVELTVELTGNGSGTVTGPNINCEGDCDEMYDINTSVTLTATPDANSNFTGWGGACASFGTNPVAEVTMDEAKHCTAEFTLNQITAGWMTGGGTLEKGQGKGKVGVSHGFELHCNPDELPNNLEVNWNNNSDRFHLETLISATCIDDPNISEVPPVAGFDTYIGEGIGRYNGVPGATITWIFTDAGEPGKDNDYGEMTITDADGVVVLSIAGSLNQGNHQAH